jgi:hypothetical protein
VTVFSWEEFSALLHNPAAGITLYLTMWKLTQHPAYAWRVIGICAEKGIPMPPEITTYLGGVAARMEGAKQASDLRAVLPKIMGFPAKEKKGPGKPLDPDDDLGVDSDDIRLAILFATELSRGRRVSKALENATAKLPAHFGSLDERSLKKRIAKAACLEIMPSTAAEWQAELHSCFVGVMHQFYLMHQSRETRA